MVVAIFSTKKTTMTLLISILATISLMRVPDSTVLKTEQSSAVRPIPNNLPAEIFIPPDRLVGLTPWTAAPITRPVFEIIRIDGFNGSIGFGEYHLQHPDKFFSTLTGYDSINIPRLYVTQQMLIGNTFRLARNFYMMSGILYGAQLGTMGNNWGMGNREGFIWHPTPTITIVIWSQHFQSLTVYSPVVYSKDHPEGYNGTAIKMPATPEVSSFGVQASFVVGEFIIGVGTSITYK
jgi:hypothetical protein